MPEASRTGSSVTSYTRSLPYWSVFGRPVNTWSKSSAPPSLGSPPISVQVPTSSPPHHKRMVTSARVPCQSGLSCQCFFTGMSIASTGSSLVCTCTGAAVDVRYLAVTETGPMMALSPFSALMSAWASVRLSNVRTTLSPPRSPSSLSYVTCTPTTSSGLLDESSRSGLSRVPEPSLPPANSRSLAEALTVWPSDVVTCDSPPPTEVVAPVVPSTMVNGVFLSLSR